MALGEYVSVSSGRDSTAAAIVRERRDLAEQPDEELRELTAYYESRGVSADTAERIATELTEADALTAHLQSEFNIDQRDVASPWHAAWVSGLAFTLGALLPMIAILLPPESIRIPVTFVAVLVGLGLTGALGARFGGSPMLRPTLRVLLGGALALGITFGIGTLLGASGAV
ncbi:VIT family protein [Microbacterium sp. SA39]|nr:VIT family protein [Microbacterium sp. SA39]